MSILLAGHNPPVNDAAGNAVAIIAIVLAVALVLLLMRKIH